MTRFFIKTLLSLTLTAYFTGTVNAQCNIDSNEANDISCAGLSNGSITLNLSDVTLPVSYNWENSTAMTTGNSPSGVNNNKVVISNLAAGIYQVTITDDTGCTTSVAGIEITAPAPLSVTGTAAGTTCGLANGTINISASGGSGAYTYAWTGGSSEQNRDLLAPGVYTVTVSDAASATCTTTGSWTINTSTNNVTLSLQNATDVRCFGESNGGITVNSSNANTFEWKDAGGTTVGTAANLSMVPVGNYTLTATSSIGCTRTLTAEVKGPSSPLTLTINTTGAGCSGNGGTASAIAGGGWGNYRYLWNTGSTAGTITGLAPTTYTVTVTDRNGTSCSITQMATVPGGAAIGAVTVSNTTKACPNGSNGVLRVSWMGGTAPFTLTWSPSGPANPVPATSPHDITGLAMGSYTITLTDAFGCTKTATGTVENQPAMTITGTVQQPVCNNGNNGAINLNVTGGTPGFSYNWGNGVTTQNRTMLSAGAYAVTVTDNAGCSATNTFTLNNPPAITASLSGSGSYCENTPLSITLNVNLTSIPVGGSGAYEVVLTNNQSGQTSTYNTLAITIPPLSATTTFTLTSVTASGCTTTINPNQNTATISVNPNVGFTINGNSPICSGAAISLSTNLPASVAFNYAWRKGNSPAIIGTLPTYEEQNVTSNTVYNLTVTAPTGCSGTSSYTVNVNPLPVLSNLSANQPKYCEKETVALSVTVAGGGPFSYAWTGPNGYVSSNPTPSFTATLERDGNYFVTVTNINTGCSNALTPQAAVVSITPLPPAPASNGNRAICEGNTNPNARTLSVNAPGYDVFWFTTPSGTQNPNNSNPNTTSFTPVNTAPWAHTYYARTRVDEGKICYSETATPVTLYINSKPVTPTEIATTYNVCEDKPAPTLTLNTPTAGSGQTIANWIGIWNQPSGNTFNGQQFSPAINGPHQVIRRVTYNNPGTGPNVCESDPRIFTFQRFTDPIVTIAAEPFYVQNIQGAFQSILQNPGSGTITNYAWDFTNAAMPNSSTEKDPDMITFTQPGDFTIKHAVKDNNNCQDSITADVTVLEIAVPLVSFAAFPQNQISKCPNDTFQIFASINNISLSDPVTEWSWIIPPGVTHIVTSGALTGQGSNFNTQPRFITNLSNTTLPFIVQFKTFSGQMYQGSIPVTVNPTPSVTLGLPPVVCTGTQPAIQVNFSGATPFTGFLETTVGVTTKSYPVSLTNLNTAFVTIDPVSASTGLKFTGLVGGGCKAPDPIAPTQTITPKSLPTLDTLEECNIDLSYTLSLNGVGTPPFVFNFTSGNQTLVFSSDTTALPFTTILSNNAFYTAFVTDGDGCRSRNYGGAQNCDCPLEEGQIIGIGANGEFDGRICPGESVQFKVNGVDLNANNAIFYELYDQNGIRLRSKEYTTIPPDGILTMEFPENTASSRWNRQYYIEGKMFLKDTTGEILTNNLCKKTTPKTYFELKGNPGVAGFGSFTPKICEGDQVSFQILTTGEPFFNIALTVAGIPDTITNTPNNPTYTFTPMIGAGNNLTIQVNSIETINGCAINVPNVSKTITINSNPVFNIVSNSPVCQGETLEVNVTGGQLNWNYIWSGELLSDKANNTIPIGASTAPSIAIYDLRVSDNQTGCFKDSSLQIQVVGNPTPKVELRNGSQAQEIELCRNAFNKTSEFKSQNQTPDTKNFWTVRNADNGSYPAVKIFSFDAQNREVAIFWDSAFVTTGNYQVILIQSNTVQTLQSPKTCTTADLFEVEITQGVAPDTTEIVLVESGDPNLRFMYALMENVCYQWGYDAPNGNVVPLAGETFRVYNVSNTFSNNRRYWVDTWQKGSGANACEAPIEGCITRSYLTPPQYVNTAAVATAPTSLSLYPNPNNGQFTLRLSSGAPGAARLRILDYTGRIIEEHNLWVQNATEEVFTVLNPLLPEGRYVAHLITADGRQMARSFIVHQP